MDPTQPAWRRYAEDPAAMNVPWVESPFFEPLLAVRDLAPRERELARHFRDQGYVILEDWIEPARIDAAVADYPRLFDPKARFENAPPGVEELLKRDPGRKQDAWHVSPAIKALATDERILGVLRVLYGREPFPFQTLNFLPGTQQPLHSDAIHFSSFPARFMCGVWIALEDATPENGPLCYVPGSHRFSEVQLESLGLWAEPVGDRLGAGYAQYEAYLEALVRINDMPVREATIKKGSVFVWAANLLHGGRPITKPGATRMSQVTHFYFEDCIYYTPIFSNIPLGEIYLREVRDLRTNERVPHRLNGRLIGSASAPAAAAAAVVRETASGLTGLIRKALGRR